jgi:hypothetical protein
VPQPWDGESPLKIGDELFYSDMPAIVTKVDLPGEWGPRVELAVRNATIITTPGLDHALTHKSGQKRPKLSTLLFRSTP